MDWIASQARWNYCFWISFITRLSGRFTGSIIQPVHLFCSLSIILCFFFCLCVVVVFCLLLLPFSAPLNGDCWIYSYQVHCVLCSPLIRNPTCSFALAYIAGHWWFGRSKTIVFITTTHTQNEQQPPQQQQQENVPVPNEACDCEAFTLRWICRVYTNGRAAAKTHKPKPNHHQQNPHCATVVFQVQSTRSLARDRTLKVPKRKQK